jgi:hypothetical protein
MMTIVEKAKKERWLLQTRFKRLFGIKRLTHLTIFLIRASIVASE